MKVFISWSGSRSKKVAEALRSWLPKVNQLVKPFMSQADIESGARWSENINQELDETSFGIICLTIENINSPWILFEAGALSKKFRENRIRVCPYIYDMSPSDVTWPLAQFQIRKADEEGTRQLVDTLNLSLENDKIQNELMNEVFNKWWSDLENTLNSIENMTEPKAHHRTQEERIDEILQIVRDMYTSRSVITDQVKDSTINDLISIEERLYNTFTTVGTCSAVANTQVFSPVVLQKLNESMHQLGIIDAALNRVIAGLGHPPPSLARNWMNPLQADS